MRAKFCLWIKGTAVAGSLTRDQDEYLVAVRWGTASKRGAVRSKVRAVAVEAHGWDGELRLEVREIRGNVSLSSPGRIG